MCLIDGHSWMLEKTVARVQESHVILSEDPFPETDMSSGQLLLRYLSEFASMESETGNVGLYQIVPE